MKLKEEGLQGKLLYYRENIYSPDFCILAEKSEKNDAENSKHTLTVTFFKNNF